MTWLRRSTITLAALVSLAAGPRGVAGEGVPTAEQGRFFEKSVRPVLVENCFSCHGDKKQKGGLRLDSREAILAGGESGPAIELGKPDESILISAIRHEDIQMPPRDKLSDPAIAALTEWVRMGAPWPGAPSGGTAGPAKGRGADFSEEDRAWWAFQPVRDPAIPEVNDGGWSRTPIDRFLFRKLHAEGLTPAPEAGRLALIRRATLDVTGLPPTPDEVDAFLADESPDAYERLVDRLLDSPHYGERWARHWLDLVRYAESDGYRLDGPRPNAWLYRDYVIRSLNDDKPYDRFVQEQIAGDELFPDSPEARVATGYLRHGIYEYNARDVKGQWTVILDDLADTTSDVFMGLGLQCARCHNHKFDPLLQADYYRLRAFFAPILPRDDLPAATDAEVEAYRAQLASWEARNADLLAKIAAVEAPYREIAANEAIGRFTDDLQAMIRKPPAERLPLEHQLAELAYRQVDYEFGRLDARIKGKDKEAYLALRKQLAAAEKDKPQPLPVPLAAVDIGPKAPPMTIPRKGDEPIEPGFPTILEPGPAVIEPLDSAIPSTGRRAALARWLTRPDNPLSTRVIVNRVWQYHFGRGLAANASDFGRLGEPPTHPDLLDWLATRFVRDGWKFKPLHRMILVSAAYRQASDHPRAADHQRKDPENRLLWRGSTRRLDAEQIRDAVLAVSGELDASAGGPSSNPSDPRLTIYTKALRNTRDPLLDVFDLPLAFNSAPSRDTTTTPIQSLLLINSQPMLLHAKAFAARLEKERPGDSAGQVEAAYRLAFGRKPTAEEVATAIEFLREQAPRIDEVEAGGADAALIRDKIPYRDGQAAVLAMGGPRQRLEVPHHESLAAGDFTVEAFFVLRSVDDGGAVRTVAAKWDGNMKTPGWAFGVTGRGSRRKPQTLVLQLMGDRGDGKVSEEAIFSDQHIRLDQPYYAAVSVSLAKAGKGPGSVSFFLKDLSNDDEPLLIAKVPHAIEGGTGNALPLTLGGRAGQKDSPFDGMIDDIRLSSGALDVAQLLFTAEGNGRNALGYWRFESEPGIFRDSTGHGLDLRPRSRGVSSVDPRRAALADFCHVLLNANEFLYVH